MRLKGKTAIVTGGASGFGAGIARKFIAEGAHVILVDINGAAAKTAAQEMGGDTFSHQCNVAISTDVEGMAHGKTLDRLCPTHISARRMMLSPMKRNAIKTAV